MSQRNRELSPMVALNIQPVVVALVVVLTGLTSVFCGGSGKLSVRQEIQQAARNGTLELNLSNRELTSLPPEIGQLTSLKILRLHSNELKELPPEIGQLTNLIELYLSENQLTAVPPEIGQLANLTVLDLGTNQLTDLPPEIGQMSNLEQLMFNRNNLQPPPRNRPVSQPDPISSGRQSTGRFAP